MDPINYQTDIINYLMQPQTQTEDTVDEPVGADIHPNKP